MADASSAGAAGLLGVVVEEERSLIDDDRIGVTSGLEGSHFQRNQRYPGPGARKWRGDRRGLRLEVAGRR
jgi:hypothetical protein